MEESLNGVWFVVSCLCNCFYNVLNTWNKLKFLCSHIVNSFKASKIKKTLKCVSKKLERQRYINNSYYYFFEKIALFKWKRVFSIIFRSFFLIPYLYFWSKLNRCLFESHTRTGSGRAGSGRKCSADPTTEPLRGNNDKYFGPVGPMGPRSDIFHHFCWDLIQN